MPLYSGGLCEAVNWTPCRPSVPDAYHSSSVLVSPASTTEAPWLRAPSANAEATSAPVTRMSRPITNSAPARSKTWTKAAPTARTPSRSHSAPGAPMMPRMSLALKIPGVITAAA